MTRNWGSVFFLLTSKRRLGLSREGVANRVHRAAGAEKTSRSIPVTRAMCRNPPAVNGRISEAKPPSAAPSASLAPSAVIAPTRPMAAVPSWARAASHRPNPDIQGGAPFIGIPFFLGGGGTYFYLVVLGSKRLSAGSFAGFLWISCCWILKVFHSKSFTQFYWICPALKWFYWW